jgi:hypothetical protein
MRSDALRAVWRRRVLLDPCPEQVCRRLEHCYSCMFNRCKQRVWIGNTSGLLHMERWLLEAAFSAAFCSGFSIEPEQRGIPTSDRYSVYALLVNRARSCLACELSVCGVWSV